MREAVIQRRLAESIAAAVGGNDRAGSSARLTTAATRHWLSHRRCWTRKPRAQPGAALG